MLNTASVKPAQSRIQLPTDTTKVPPLHTKRGSEGPLWIPLRVCGFLIPIDFLVAYAKKYLPDDFEAKYSDGMVEEYRRQNALKHVKKLLGIPHYVLVRLADDEIEACLIVGSNYDEEELARACDPAVIEKFREVLHLDGTCMPRWYRIHKP